MYIYTSGHEEVSFILNSVPPISKTKTLKRMSSTPGMTPVKKWSRKFTNLRICDERLFTDDDDTVPDFGEKVISFRMENDN